MQRRIERNAGWCIETFDAERGQTLDHYATFPIVGGTPPKLAWKYLETVVNKVLPALAA